MKGSILSLFAETSLHPGVGQVVGAVDLPVAREKTTGYPVIVGSSLKGALRDKAEQVWGEKEEKLKRIFGESNQAGSLLITDARLLLLPVRSLPGPFKWVTCPYILERLKRDGELMGLSWDFDIPDPGDKALVQEEMGELFLEEIVFSTSKGKDLNKIVETLKEFIPHDSVKKRLETQLVIIDDKEFQYFAQYGLPVNARNVLNKNKTSDNLWYEEVIPPDTLFYSLIFERKLTEDQNDLYEVESLFKDSPYLQVGGNETIGQGWCRIQWFSGGESR
ncbi:MULTISPECIES: type III-B CRISPR module RAMP protein Cmr4 [Thermoanaerobacteraceae]|nr:MULTISPECIES: type III-B CRISPR module RAMP protein Cmr4 [Thermoanaerobacteraceae]AIS53492.1 CRISPR subtype III-B-associated RAMP protein Cmr4 [Thermoanaerobacter kivui]MBE3579396.1 type III-B CRISPR module RAMP protein Cmr4 [Caldanaerobacter subterraneus]TCO63533.1 CRISPR-associated Cmr4 family protein [Caldanaerobacter subterraneus]